jgi:hypothetical protein
MANRTLLFCAFISVLSFTLGILFEKYEDSVITGSVYLRTKEPMLLGAEGQVQDFHVLPAGAALYKFKDFPEGHTTYITYINIKGVFASERVESDKANLVDPLWALRIRPEEVRILLENTPVSKDDLVRILKARRMTWDDLAQIVSDWSE